MVFVETLIGDLISSFIPNGKPSGARSGGGARAPKRGKRFFNIGANQAAANRVVVGTGGSRKSDRNKFIRDAKEATRFSGADRFKF